MANLPVVVCKKRDLFSSGPCILKLLPSSGSPSSKFTSCQVPVKDVVILPSILDPLQYLFKMSMSVLFTHLGALQNLNAGFLIYVLSLGIFTFMSGY